MVTWLGDGLIIRQYAGHQSPGFTASETTVQGDNESEIQIHLWKRSPNPLWI